MPKPSIRPDAAAADKTNVDAALETMVAIKPSRESKEWLMNSRTPPSKELEKLIPPRRLRRLPKMPEKKWKEWPINKKRMLPTRKSQTLETKPPRKPIRPPQVLVPEVLLMPPSRRLKMLPRH